MLHLHINRILLNITFSIIIVLGDAFAHKSDLRFKQFSPGQPISNQNITHVFQDSHGFIWIGTEDGLQRFDGYDLVLFRHDPADSNSISDNFISIIAEDRYTGQDGKRYLWIGTETSGLNRYDPMTGQWQRYYHNPKDPKSLAHNFVYDILSDKDSTLWVATRGGLSRMAPNQQGFRNYAKYNNGPSNDLIITICESPTESNTLWLATLGAINKVDTRLEKFIKYPIDAVVEEIVADRSGNLWLGSQEGYLFRFDPVTNKLVQYKSGETRWDNNFGNFIRGLQFSRSGELFIGSDIGLFRLRYDPSSGYKIRHYQHDPFDHFSIGDDVIKDLFLDKSDILWTGTARGLFRVNLGAKKFRHIRHDPDDPNSLSHDNVRAIFQDRDGIIWVSAWENGINRYDHENGRWRLYEENPNDSTSLLRNQVWDICQTQDGTIWLATNYGLDRFDPLHDNFFHYQKEDGNNQSLKINNVTSLLEDSKNNFWLGCNTGIVEKFIREKSIFRHYYNIWEKPGTFPKCRFIYDIFEDQAGTIWFATEGAGLAALRPENQKDMIFDHYPAIDGDPSSIGHNTIHHIFEDHNGVLWFATRGGLSKLISRNNGKIRFKTFTTKEGMSNDVVYGILEDSRGNLWLSTNLGLVRFDPLALTFRNYTQADGLQADQFSINSVCKTLTGEFLFGGIGGITIFNPDSIFDITTFPSVLITDIQIFNRSLKVSDQSPLEKYLPFTRHLILKHNQSVITLKFAALEFALPEKINFKYKLEGIDPDWVDAGGSRRQVTYTNLVPGNYTFKVQSTNADAIWNEHFASLDLTILPPWWLTHTAYIIYILAGLILFILIWHTQEKRIKTRHKLELEHVQTEKLKELDRLKSRFFADISHEFRTPLTLIEGPIRQFINGDLVGNLKDHCRIVLKHSGQLLDLVNQILDLSKMEAGKMRLQVTITDAVPLVRGLAAAFESLATQLEIDYRFVSGLTRVEIFLDRVILEKIINNLLINAFKFTPANGKIRINLDKETAPFSPEFKLPGHTPGSYLKISVSNTGPGIDPNILPYIFDRFYQKPGAESRHQASTGIGLSLVKEYTELHKGQVRAESLPGQETTFSVYLPIDSSHFNDNEIIDTPPPNHINKIIIPQKSDDRSVLQSGFINSLPSLLIVEDNTDVRQYMAGFLAPLFRIIEASDGLSGLGIARKEQPDIILSDIMMPEMDGYQLCKKVKSDIEISHIPVILLTARAAQEEKETGLKLGADDYITKPFEVRELQLRLQNILDQKNRIYERFKRESEISPSQMKITSVDEKFLGRLFLYIENSLSRYDLTTDQIAIHMNISRATLSRKLNALLNMTPVELIRFKRLQKARHLFNSGFGNVSEVAMESGFNSLSYFSHCYNRQFGISPSQEILGRRQISPKEIMLTESDQPEKFN